MEMEKMTMKKNLHPMEMVESVAAVSWVIAGSAKEKWSFENDKEKQSFVNAKEKRSLVNYKEKRSLVHDKEMFFICKWWRNISFVNYKEKRSLVHDKEMFFHL